MTNKQRLGLDLDGIGRGKHGVNLTSNKKGLAAQVKKFIGKYTPYKGAECPICGKFCKTTHTDLEAGVRFHKCINCDKAFQSFSKPNKRSRVPNAPTSIDAKENECLNNSIDTKKVARKTKRKARGRKK